MFRFLILMTMLVTATQTGMACNVPVFRYALERWQPDLYEVFVFSNRELTKTEQTTLNTLKEGNQKFGLPNLSVINVDLKSLEESGNQEIKEIWEDEKKRAGKRLKLPWVVVYFPYESRIPDTLWTGPLTEVSPAMFLKSQLRVNIAEKLIAGESTVWVQLDSGNKAADDAAFGRLKNVLNELQLEMKLPELTPEDDQFLTGEGPELKLSFTALRFTVAEQKREPMTKRMLLSADPALLKQLNEEPLVVPVFGRGRALTILTQENLKKNGSIDEVATFLVGPCSCRIKKDNPGYDLLMPINWDEKITRIVKQENIEPLALPELQLSGFGEIPMMKNKKINRSSRSPLVAPRPDTKNVGLKQFVNEGNPKSVEETLAVGTETVGTETVAPQPLARPKSTANTGSISLVKNVGILFGVVIGILLIVTMIVARKPAS